MRRLLGLVLLAALLPGPAAADVPTTCFGAATNDNRATDNDDFLTGTPGQDIVALSTGDDQYFSSSGEDLVCGNGGADVLVGEDEADSIDGGNGADILAGMSGSDLLKGGGGSDVIRGNDGADTLRGGIGDGAPDDIYDGVGADQVFGQDEDTWHRCGDDVADDHSGFTGLIVPDPDCG